MSPGFTARLKALWLPSGLGARRHLRLHRVYATASTARNRRLAALGGPGRFGPVLRVHVVHEPLLTSFGPSGRTACLAGLSY